MAVDDDFILKNPFGFELGTVLVNDSQKRQAVSPEDETKFLDFVKNDPHYNQYYDCLLYTSILQNFLMKNILCRIHRTILSVMAMRECLRLRSKCVYEIQV